MWYFLIGLAIDENHCQNNHGETLLHNLEKLMFPLLKGTGRPDGTLFREKYSFRCAKIVNSFFLLKIVKKT